MNNLILSPAQGASNTAFGSTIEMVATDQIVWQADGVYTPETAISNHAISSNYLQINPGTWDVFSQAIVVEHSFFDPSVDYSTLQINFIDGGLASSSLIRAVEGGTTTVFDVNKDGTVTAYKFVGDGSDLTNLPSTGAPFDDATAIIKGSADATKLLRIEVDGFTTATTRVLTPPNYDGTIATLTGTETQTNKTFTTGNAFNGTVGQTTPLAGSFTTLTASGTSNFSGNLIFSADSTYDIGASGANRPRNVRAAERLYAGFSVDTLYLNVSSYAAFGLNLVQGNGSGILGLYNEALSIFSRLQFGGTSSSFPALQISGTTITAGLANGTAGGALVASGTLAVTGISTHTGGTVLGTKTVGTLPTASSNTYLSFIVTDSLAPVLSANVASGGSAKAAVRSNGTDWIVTEVL
jgi:hypothetical protein